MNAKAKENRTRVRRERRRRYRAEQRAARHRGNNDRVLESAPGPALTHAGVSEGLEVPGVHNVSDVELFMDTGIKVEETITGGLASGQSHPKTQTVAGGQKNVAPALVKALATNVSSKNQDRPEKTEEKPQSTRHPAIISIKKPRDLNQSLYRPTKRKRNSPAENYIANASGLATRVSACIKPVQSSFESGEIQHPDEGKGHVGIKEEKTGKPDLIVGDGPLKDLISQYFKRQKQRTPEPRSPSCPSVGSPESPKRYFLRHLRIDTPPENPPRGGQLAAKLPSENIVRSRHFNVPLVKDQHEFNPHESEEYQDAAGESPVEPQGTGNAGSGLRKLRKTSSYFTGSAEVEQPGIKRANTRVSAGVSATPWPPLTSNVFGLIQEELQPNSFHVIIACIFLNKTRGKVAIPLLRMFLEAYPTPLALSQGDLTTIIDFLRPLGLQKTRAKTLINLGKVWVENPPTPGNGSKKYNYPPRDTKPFNISIPIGLQGMNRGLPKHGVENNCFWEISHLPGVGPYALDSWRIFCLDHFRQEGNLGSIVNPEQVEPGNGNGDGGEEWRRVVPKDKELRAYIRWKWAKEGLTWTEEGDHQTAVPGSVASDNGEK